MDSRTPESNRNCGVVCLVKSPFDFWIQSDQNKAKYAELCNELKTTYSTTESSQLVREPVIGGIYCVLNSILYEWQRCEVLQISNREVYILHIDVGSRDLVPISSLRQLKESVKYIPRLAIHCSIDGIKPPNGELLWSKQAIQSFSKLVFGKTVTFLIKSKDSDSFKIDLFVKSINVSEQLCHDQLAVHQNSLTRTKSIQSEEAGMIETLRNRFVQTSINVQSAQEQEVIITCVYSPFCFYAQLLSGDQEFKEFEMTMQGYIAELVNKSEAVYLLEPHIGQMCVAKFSEDGAWYRAVIKDLIPSMNQAVVFYTDYGNQDTVTLDSQSLIAIHDKFKDFPSAAFKCCLNGIRPLEESVALSSNITMARLTDFVYETVQSGSTMATFLSKSLDDGYLIELRVITSETESINMRNALLDRKLVNSINDSAAAHLPPRKLSNARQITQLVSDQAARNNKMPTTVTMENLADPNQSLRFKEYTHKVPSVDIKLTKEFEVTCVETLGEFYVRVPSESFNKVHFDLQYFYAKKSNLPSPTMKDGCACVFYNDVEKWWERARIVSVVDSDHCLVKLVDRGDTKYCHKSNLRVIHDKYLNEPCQAIEASLSDLQPDEEISEEANERFKSMVSNKILLGKITEIIKSPDDGDVKKLLLNLFDENQDSIYSLLVQELDTSKNIELYKFKPTIRSDMDETKITQSNDLTLNTTNNAADNHINQANNLLSAISQRIIDPRALMEKDTSPFPIHEENIIKRPEQPSMPASTSVDSNRRVFTNGFAKETLLTPVNQVLSQPAPLTVSVDQVDSQRQLKRPTELQLDSNQKVQKPQIKIVVNQTTQLAHYKAITFENIIQDITKPYVGTLSYSESLNHFYIQIRDYFAKFDGVFEQFQKSCANRNGVKIDWNEFKKIVAKDEANTLALAAKFYDDQTWYRGRLVREDFDKVDNETDPQIWIEFIDYGNRQKTRLSDCVFLSEKFIEYKACAIKCNGVAYLDAILASHKLDTQMLESLLIEGTVVRNTDVPERYEFESYFRVQGDKVLAEIDSFYTGLYRNRLINMDYKFDPVHYNDKILRQANLEELNEVKADQNHSSTLPIRIVEAKLANIDSLEYMYFNMVSTLESLNQLEKQLEDQKESELIPVDSKELQFDVFYLAKCDNRLYRSMPLTSDSIKLVDYGRTLDLNRNAVKFFKLMPKYFRHGTYSVHGRLPMSNAIQKVWTPEEKDKFISQIKTGSIYHIKLFNTYEPYIIEFYDKNQIIDYKFDSIIDRVLSGYSTESQCLVKGYRLIFNQEDFYLGGNMLKKSADSNYKLELTCNDSGTFHDKKIYIYTDHLLERLAEYQNIVIDHICKATGTQKPVTSLVKGNIYLTTTTSAEFLSSIQIPMVQNLIANGFSRVRVNRMTKNTRTGYRFVHITYLDYGIEDMIRYQEDVNDVTFTSYSNYKFYPIYRQLLLWPTFLFECRLDKNKLVNKLHSLALKENSFLDPDYINTKINDIGSALNRIPLRVELLTPLGRQPEEPPFVVDLYNKTTNQNIIDIIFDNALKSISNFMFECIIVHVNTVDDFYIQKQDAYTKDTLNALQARIQDKVAKGELKPVEHVELNKLCVAFFHDDQQFYRAKVIEEHGSFYTVFFIDYGNTSQVDKSQLRSISDDLIANVPKSFAINCKLKVIYEDAKYREVELLRKREQLTEYLCELLETNQFLVKCLERRKEVKYDDSFVYLVEVFDADTQVSLLDMFIEREAEKTQMNRTEVSCQQMTYNQSLASSNSGDDRAIATDLTQEITSNQTNMQGELTELTRFESDLKIVPPPQLFSNNPVLSRQESLDRSEDIREDNATWNETPADLKNYNPGEDTFLDAADTTKPDDPFSTCNESAILAVEKTDEFVELKECIVSFFHSDKDFFIQASDIDTQMAKLQPQIDECLDIYDHTVSPLCIGQFDADQFFYRLRVIKWNEEQNSAYCLLIDYGNKENINLDTITSMTPELIKTPPLAINCYFKDLGDLTPAEISTLVEIVSRELVFDSKIKRTDLDKFYQDPSQLCPVELYFSATGQKLDRQILNDQDALAKIILTHHQNLSPHPIVTIDALRNKPHQQKRRRLASDAYKLLQDINLPKETTLNCTNSTDIRMYLYQPSSGKVNATIDDDECLPSLSLSQDSIKTFSSNMSAASNHPKNLTVSQFNDTQNWSVSDHPDVDHPDYLAQTFLKDETTWLSEKNRSEMTTHNQSQLDMTTTSRVNNKNETASRFGDQDSNWLDNSLNTTKADSTQRNLTVSRFPDQDSNWSMNRSLDQDQTVIESNKNTTVSRFADQSSLWGEISRSEKQVKERSKSFNGEAIKNSAPMPNLTRPQRNIGTKEKMLETDEESQSTVSELDDEDQISYQGFYSGNVIDVKSLENFYIQPIGADNDLMNIKSQLDKLQLKPFDKIPAVGSLCICKYHIDKQLYRAQIIENHDVTRLKVFFIDYGNEDCINIAEIFRMEPVLKNIKPLAENCQLYFTDKFNEIVKRLRENESTTSTTSQLNPNLSLLSSGLSIPNRLVKCFKILTSKSKVIARVRKELSNPNDPYKRKRNLVDLFLVPQNYDPKESNQSKERNILDDLLLETIYLLVNEPSNLISLNNQLSKVDDQQFSGFVTNLKPFQKAYSLQFQVQSMTFIRMINKLIEIFQSSKNNRTLGTGKQIMCLVRLPKFLINKLYEGKESNNLYARAIILDTDSSFATVKLIDYNYKMKMSKTELIQMSPYGEKVLGLIPAQTSFYTIMLNEQTNTFIHVNMSNSNISYLFQLFKMMLNYQDFDQAVGFSSVFKFECKQKDRPFAALITDPDRDNLSLNKIIELTVACITSPFSGVVTNIGTDPNNIEFECLHDLAKNKPYMSELNKILNATGLFDSECEMHLEKGQFCLIDLTPQQKVNSNRMRDISSESILSLSEQVIDPDIVNVTTQANTSRELYRAMLIEQFEDKYLVLNLENGKKCSLARKRVKSVTMNHEPVNTNCYLAQIIPSLLIKVNSSLASYSNPDGVVKTLHNSRFYGTKISLHFNQEIWMVSWILNRETDLYKTVSSIDQNHKMDAATTSPLGNLHQQVDLSKFYSLVHVDSFELFYIRSNEANSIVAQIEKKIEQEYLSFQDACLVSNRKCPPNLLTIYGIRWSKQKKFSRVLLLAPVNSMTSDDFYRVFFVDHGYVDVISLQDLILISDPLQRMPPQTICCKLYGQQQMNKDDDVEKEKMDFFRCLMKNKCRLFASIYKEYSINRKITNYIPLQSDNTCPIEVILHIISEDGSMFSDLSDVLNKIASNKRAALSGSTHKFKPFPGKINALLADRNELKSVEVVGIHNVNKFHLRMENSKSLLDKLNNDMAREYKVLLSSNNLNNLRVQELQKGLPCVYVDGDVARRAVIVEFKPYQANDAHDSSTIDVQVKIYLIDIDREHSLINTALLYPLLDKYLNQETLCFECSLCSENDEDEREANELHVERFKQIVNSYKYFKIKVLGIITKKSQNGFNKYYVNLLAGQANNLPEQEMINVKEAVFSSVKQIKVELDDSVVSSSTPSPVSIEENKFVKRVDINQTVVHVSSYLETSFRQGAVFKVQLTNLDTANQFSIVLSSDSAKRLKFIHSFHVWHKENRSSLRLVYDSTLNKQHKRVGIPCTFNSTLYAKWTRGIVVSTDFSAGQSIVYAVEYSRNFVVGHERLYLLENHELMNEPIYSIRCMGEDDKEQREKLSKYIDLIKTGTKSEAASSNTNALSSPSPAAPHLSIENFELELKIVGKQLAPLCMDQVLHSYQQIVRILEIRRIKSPFTSSRLPLLTNSPAGGTRLFTISPASPLSANISLKRVEHQARHHQMNYDNDQSIENKLSSHEHNMHSMRDAASTNHLGLDSSKIRSRSPQGGAGENDEENMTFNAITESTRIYQTTTPSSEGHHEISDLIPPSQLSISNNRSLASNFNVIRRRYPLDSEQKIEEETSKWIREETSKSFESETSKHLVLNETGDLKLSQKYRVRLLEKPKLSDQYLILQRVDLKNSYDRLKAAMNAYYEKIANASRSLEKTTTSTNETHENSLFAHTFNVGDHCAAFIDATKSWSRCVVLIVDEISKKAYIECVDDCLLQITPLNKLEKLNDNFKTLNKYAFRAKLATSVASSKVARIIHQKGAFDKELTAEIVNSGVDTTNKYKCKQTIYEINLYLPDKINLLD